MASPLVTIEQSLFPSESLEDLSKQQSVKYGPVNGTAALVYFTRMKQIEEDFYQYVSYNSFDLIV